MWHHAGRLTKKCNSFQDFIACANYLVEHGYAHPKRLAAWGISAGGLLVGATINMFPNLFRAAILEVHLREKGSSIFCDVSDYLDPCSLHPMCPNDYRGIHSPVRVWFRTSFFIINKLPIFLLTLI